MLKRGFPGGASTYLPASVGDVRDVDLIPGSEDPLEEGVATHSSTCAWKIPWTEKPGRLQSMGSQRLGYG